MADEIFGFSRAIATRLVAAMIKVERFFRTGGQGDRPGFSGAIHHGYIARTGGSGIPAKSGSTAGSGTVTLYTFDGTTLTLGSDTLVVKNAVAAAIGANKDVIVHWANGYPWVFVEPCS